jgi:hypothetical protein
VACTAYGGINRQKGFSAYRKPLDMERFSTDPPDLMENHLGSALCSGTT